MMNHPEIKSQDFTTKKNDDTIKVSDNTTIKNSLTENSVKLENSFEAPKSYPYKEQKPKDNFTLNKEYKTGDIFKIPKFKPTIPNEKLERKRLERLTGAYDLNNVSSDVIEQNKRLKKKTDPNYYRDDKNLTPKEVNQRLDEAFGPKTDFSIHNFENNYDKLNAEEQGMLTHKMQLHFNNVGYGDSQGFHLETDGIFGPKTQGAYKRYIRDNKEDYDEAIADKKAYEDYESIVTGDKALKEAELMLKNTNAKPKFSEYTPADVKVNSASDTKTSTSEPKTYEVAKTSYTTSNSNTSKAIESEITSQSRTGRNASPVSSRSYDRGNRSSINENIKSTTNIIDSSRKKKIEESTQQNLNNWLSTSQNRKFKEEFIKETASIIKKTDSLFRHRLPGTHQKSNEVQKEIWKYGAENILRKKMNCQTAAWMLEHSLEENPSDIVRYNDSNIAYKINNSKEYLDKIDELIKASKNGIIDKPDESIDFSNSDNDLYLSINKASFHIKGFMDDKGVWYINTTMEDTYDFTEILLDYGTKPVKILGTIANDAAYCSQISGAIKPYKVTVNFYTRRDPNEG